ncbi:unnamed protein product [Phytophthora fragariaefolia]|uniref:Unnamed protein product n=1 Tax=Phytophthora fragariaefolia TaxID=1490495 RepID=A0A9W6Y7J8_9STRA|nr:unnamed protein product [Phytophthora fragariaefolia]
MVLGSGLLCLTVLSLAAPPLARVTSVLLYLWVEVSTQWLTQQFWDLCAKAFDVAQSKKFFGVITFGSTCGSLLASFVVLPVLQARHLPTEANLLVAAGMLFFIAGVLLVTAGHFASAGPGQNPAGTKKDKARTGGLPADATSSDAIVGEIQARTYLKHICFFDMMATVMRVLVDNTTLSVLSLQPEEEVKASLSMVNGLQSLLMIPMQLLSGPFFTHFGVMYGIAMLPVSIFLFGASTYFSSVSGVLFSELRALFYKKNRDGIPLTPMHTKLRLLNLHTAAKREFVLHAQESYVLPDSSTFPTGIFNTMDLMMLVKDKSVAVPRQLRVAAILACGYEKFNMNVDQCSEMLHKLLHSGDEDKSVVVCAAVALLRLSDWMDEEANVILQRLLHEEKVLEARVVGLKIVGKQLPELLGDGFLVYLLHHSSTQIIQAAVECCTNSARNSRMLIPALMKHLSNSVLRSQVVTALQGFEPAALWGPLCQYTEEMLELPLQELSSYTLASDRNHSKTEGLAGALKVLDLGAFPFEDKLKFLLHLIETLLVTSKSQEGEIDSTTSNSDVLHHLFGKDVVIEELVVDALLSLISSTDEKTMHSFSQLMDPIHHALSIKIREAHGMRHVLELFFQICPRTASNIEETSPLLLQHVEHSLKDTLRLLLKLLSTGFPKEFDVAVILEGLQSDLGQVHSAIQVLCVHRFCNAAACFAHTDSVGGTGESSSFGLQRLGIATAFPEVVLNQSSVKGVK